MDRQWHPRLGILIGSPHFPRSTKQKYLLVPHMSTNMVPHMSLHVLFMTCETSHNSRAWPSLVCNSGPESGAVEITTRNVPRRGVFDHRVREPWVTAHKQNSRRTALADPFGGNGRFPLVAGFSLGDPVIMSRRGAQRGIGLALSKLLLPFLLQMQCKQRKL